MFGRLLRKPVGRTERYGCCTPEMPEGDIQAQKDAHLSVSPKANQLARHVRATVKHLCPRKPLISNVVVVGDAELKKQKDACEKRTAERLACGQESRGAV